MALNIERTSLVKKNTDLSHDLLTYIYNISNYHIKILNCTHLHAQYSEIVGSMNMKCWMILHIDNTDDFFNSNR